MGWGRLEVGLGKEDGLEERKSREHGKEKWKDSVDDGRARAKSDTRNTRDERMREKKPGGVEVIQGAG